MDTSSISTRPDLFLLVQGAWDWKSQSLKYTFFLCTPTWNSSNAQMSHFVSDNKKWPRGFFISTPKVISVSPDTSNFFYSSSLNGQIPALPPSEEPFTARRWPVLSEAVKSQVKFVGSPLVLDKAAGILWADAKVRCNYRVQRCFFPTRW